MFLMADMGGTNIRFAVFNGQRTIALTYYKCADFSTFSDVIKAYREKIGKLPPSFILAVPGPSAQTKYAFVNNPWRFSVSDLKKEFSFKSIHIVNDFEAAAMAIPFLTSKDVVQVKSGKALPTFPKLIIGAGTGLGVGILLPLAKGKYKAVPSEGGHITLCDTNAQENKIKQFVMEKYGRASAEHFISGLGLKNIYQALTGNIETPENIIERAVNGDNSCRQAMLQMFAFWGDVTGDLALTIGAFGGIYLTGGIIRIDGVFDLFKQSKFLERFECKGRHTRLMQNIPVKVIAQKDTVFRGLKSIGLS
ncbi:MAG: glucokinase [Alphaproteobacteria bacterium]|nr:glucokinase [Alphaproteobacteria bacterium]